MRLDGPLEVFDAVATPAEGLTLAPRDALAQPGPASDWALVTLRLDAATPPWVRAQTLRALVACVVTEAHQVVSIARLVRAPALLRDPEARDGVVTYGLAVDLRAVGLRGLDEAHHIHVAAGLWRSSVQRREPVAAPTPSAAMAHDVDALVHAYACCAAGRYRDALTYFDQGLRGRAADDLSRPNLYNAACAAARVAARSRDAAERERYESTARAWLRADLALLEGRMLDTWRALGALKAGDARDHLLRRREALAAHLDLRATDVDLARLAPERG